jgi:hypothetical protein
MHARGLELWSADSTTYLVFATSRSDMMGDANREESGLSEDSDGDILRDERQWWRYEGRYRSLIKGERTVRAQNNLGNRESPDRGACKGGGKGQDIYVNLQISSRKTPEHFSTRLGMRGKRIALFV